MKEPSSDTFSLSIPKNNSLPISKEKFKKSKLFHAKIGKNFQSSSKKSTSEKNQKLKKKFLSLYIINSQLQKHNSNPLKKNIMIINDIIGTKTNHFLAIFKDYLITDYVDEFLKRYFLQEESEELLPKFYIYYQNYLKFFCRGFFTDFDANKIIQDYGECQAELYYNNNYGGKGKKKKNQNDENNNQNSSKNESNNTNSNLDKIKQIFNDTVKNSINKIENSKLLRNYIDKYNTNEISNICYKSKNETMTLNDDTKVYNSDNIITNENSLSNLIDDIFKKRKAKKKMNKSKIIKNNNINNNKNIVNLYKNLLNQSPLSSARNFNENIKNCIYNKTTKKISSIKIFNKNIPIIIKNKKINYNISNENNDNAKTSIFFDNPKIQGKNFNSRNNRNQNNSNLFMKSYLTQKNYYKNNSKSTSSRNFGSNFPFTKNKKNKFTSFNTNLNINHQKSKKLIKYNGFYYQIIDNNLLSTSISRNLKKNFIYNYHSNNNNNSKNNNNQKINRINHHFQYMANRSKNQLKYKKSNNKHKQSYSLSNSNSIFNNYHININNNIMLLNNNTHYASNKNNLKSNSKSKRKIDDIKLTLSKQNKSRNNIGLDLKKYKTEIKIYNNIKNKRNTYSSIKKYIYLVKAKSRNKEKTFKNKEILIRNKSNIFSNRSCFKIKKIEDSDIMPSLKNIKKLNNSNKNLNLNKISKTNIIFDYKRK